MTSSKEHLEALASLVPSLEDGSFQAGQWAGGETGKDGYTTMPWFEWGDGMKAFVTACGPLMLRDFSWPAWKDTPESRRARDDIENASEDDLRRVITTIVRQERFVEGLLASAYEDGYLLRICKRAEALVEAVR